MAEMDKSVNVIATGMIHIPQRDKFLTRFKEALGANDFLLNHRKDLNFMKTSLLKSGSIVGLFCILGLLGCASTISTYDQYAYVQTTNLKVESLALLDKAVDSVSKYIPAIEDIEMKLNKAYEYEKGRQKNEISTQLWEILKSPDKHLLGGVLKRWRDEKQLGAGFITNEKKIIGEAFDIIAELESKKIKQADAQSKFQKL
jgi:hypothetical protein